MSAELARALVASLDEEALDELARLLAPRLPGLTGLAADEPLTVAQAAARAGVSPRTIRRAITSGVLDGHQVAGRWRTTTSALGAWQATGGPTGAAARPQPSRRSSRSVSGPTSAADAILGTGLGGHP